MTSRSGSSRRKPNVTWKVKFSPSKKTKSQDSDEDDDDLEVIDLDDSVDININGNGNEDCEEIPDLPEGTVIVNPEPVDSDSEPETNTSVRSSAKKEKKAPPLYTAAEINEVFSKVKCTSCGNQINPRLSGSTKRHPDLQCIVCRKCFKFFQSGEIEKDEDGVDEQCRWCYEGGRLFGCDYCTNVFCKNCIMRNLGRSEITKVDSGGKWKCYVCDPMRLKDLVEQCNKVIKCIKFEEKKDKEKSDKGKDKESGKKSSSQSKSGTGTPKEKVNGTAREREKSQKDKVKDEKDNKSVVAKKNVEATKKEPEVVVVEPKVEPKKNPMLQNALLNASKGNSTNVRPVAIQQKGFAPRPLQILPNYSIRPQVTASMMSGASNFMSKPVISGISGASNFMSKPVTSGITHSGPKPTSKLTPGEPDYVDISLITNGINVYNCESVIKKLQTISSSLQLMLNAIKTDLDIARLNAQIAATGYSKDDACRSLRTGLEIFFNALRETFTIPVPSAAERTKIAAALKSLFDAPVSEKLTNGPVQNTSTPIAKSGVGKKADDPEVSCIPISIDDSEVEESPMKKRKLDTVDENKGENSDLKTEPVQTDVGEENDDVEMTEEKSSSKDHKSKEEKKKEKDSKGKKSKDINLVSSDEENDEDVEMKEGKEKSSKESKSKDDKKTEKDSKDSKKTEETKGRVTRNRSKTELLDDSENTAAQLELLKEMADELSEKSEREAKEIKDCEEGIESGGDEDGEEGEGDAVDEEKTEEGESSESESDSEEESDEETKKNRRGRSRRTSAKQGKKGPGRETRASRGKSGKSKSKAADGSESENYDSDLEAEIEKLSKTPVLKKKTRTVSQESVEKGEKKGKGKKSACKDEEVGRDDTKKSKKHRESDSENYDSDLEGEIDELSKTPMLRKKKQRVGQESEDEEAEGKDKGKKPATTKLEEKKEGKKKGKKEESSSDDDDDDNKEDEEEDIDEVEEEEDENVNMRRTTRARWKQQSQSNEKAKRDLLKEMESEEDEEDQDDEEELDEEINGSSDSEVVLSPRKARAKATGGGGGKHGKGKKSKVGDESTEIEEDTEEEEDKPKKKKKGLKNRLLDKKISDDDSDSDFVKPKKGKGKKRKRDSDESSDSDVAPKKKTRGRKKAKQESDSESEQDSDSDFQSTKKKGKGKKNQKGKKGRKKKGSDSDSDSSSEEEEESDSDESTKGKKKKGKKKGGKKGQGKGKGKRKRIKEVVDSSDDGEGRKEKGDDDDDDESSDSDDETQGGYLKRKNIRKVQANKKLDKATRRAQRAEEQRRTRIEEKQKEYNSYVEVEDTEEAEAEAVTPGSPIKVKCPVTTKLILEMDKETKKPIIEVDKTLIRKLKPHQVEAVNFIWNCCVENLARLEKDPGAGCILAHCMGLGKTLSVISFVHTMLKHYKKTKFRTCLVVAPLNTVLNWQREFTMWLEDVNYDIITHELASIKENRARARELQDWQDEGGIMIMGYDMFRNLTQGKHCKSKKIKEIFQKTLVDPGPDLVVCDEGHILKNDASAISKAMNLVKSRRRIVLTGTPLQNNLIEYHCMVSFVKPSLLGTRKEFGNRFVNPITNGQCSDSTPMDVKIMKRRAHILHDLLNGCVQRKDYSALTKFLPPKHEYVIAVRLSKVQVQMYEKYLELSGQGINGNISTKGARLFSDYQNLMRIWTHPWVLKLDEIRQESRMKYDDDSEDSFIDDSESSGSESSMSLTDSDGEVSTVEVSEDEDVAGGSRRSKKTRAERMKKKEEEKVQDEKKDEVVKKWTTRSRGLEYADGAGPSWANLGAPGGSDSSLPPAVSSDWWGEFVKSEDQHKLELSGKLMLLFEILKMCEEIGDKVLVFSQSLLSLDIIEDFLEKIDRENHEKEEAAKEEVKKEASDDKDKDDKDKDDKDKKDNEDEEEENKEEEQFGKSWTKGADYFRMDGATNPQHRKAACDLFNSLENYRARLFLISTKAGSLGINLVAANRVIIFDASWNPSHDIQSIFRVYRFGQIKPCYIYRFLAQGTMEEKIYERQVTKQSLSQRVVDEHQIERHFTASDLQELYNFQPDRLDDPNRKERPVPALPKDHMLAELLSGQKEWIVGYHEHDSLLENIVSEELNEEERKAAWDEYEKEKQGIYQNRMPLMANPNLNMMNRGMYGQPQGMPMMGGMMGGIPGMGPNAILQIVQDLKMRFPNLPPDMFQQRVQAVLRQVLTQQIMEQQEMQRRQVEKQQMQEMQRLNQLKLQIQRQQQQLEMQQAGLGINSRMSMVNNPPGPGSHNS